MELNFWGFNEEIWQVEILKEEIQSKKRKKEKKVPYHLIKRN